jgi:hypothetical protein
MQRIPSRKGEIPYGSDDFWVALEAEQDMTQLAFILSQPFAQPGNVRFKQRLDDCLKDDALPQNLGKKMQSTGRDAQFELLLAAFADNAGLRPVDLAEPDVTCVLDGATVVIAAKRLKRVARLRNEIKDAAHQIKRSGRPGIIAIDETLARNEQNKALVAQLPDDWFDCIIPHWGRQTFDEHADDIRKWVKGSGVLGVVVFQYTKRLRHPSREWGLDGSSTWLQTTANAAVAHKLYKDFYAAFVSGMPNLLDLSD